MLAPARTMTLVAPGVDVEEPAVAVHAGMPGARLRNTHVHVIGVERAARDALHVEPERNVETSEVRFEHALWEPEVEQRAEQHVARDAREGVEMQDPGSRIQVAAGVRLRLRRIPPRHAPGTARPLPGLALRGG